MPPAAAVHASAARLHTAERADRWNSPSWAANLGTEWGSERESSEHERERERERKREGERGGEEREIGRGRGREGRQVEFALMGRESGGKEG